MDFSYQQMMALGDVMRWLRYRDKQVYRLFGYAGTGKTTLAKHLAGDHKVLFAAYTGKAAHVLQTKGCTGATTLHSLAYVPVERSKARLQMITDEIEKLKAEISKLEQIKDASNAHLHRRVEILNDQLKEEARRLRQPKFELNPDSPIRDADLLIIDECSMVDDRMGNDLLSFGTPVLVLGDTAQLPPVRGEGFFTRESPDCLLDEVHRQAQGNPIIDLATSVRQGRYPVVGTYGESRVMASGDFDRDAISKNAQVLVGKNDTRRRANAHRRQSLGIIDALPVVGDRVVCLRNEHDVGLLNGSTWNVLGRYHTDEGVGMVVQSCDDGRQLAVEAHKGHFLGEDVGFWERRQRQEFDYGWALTVHKSQGSQWSEVVIVDESRVFRDNWARHLYTAITRASERVDVVLT